MNFGIVADAAKASPFEAPGFATPIARPLVGVQAREDQDASASQVFEGSIAVRQGDTPAMAFVIGTDVLFENGWVRVHEGSSTWIGPSEPGASGTSSSGTHRLRCCACSAASTSRTPSTDPDPAVA